MVFHKIHESYPGLQWLQREQPAVVQVNDFLSERECRQIMELARPALRPCLVKNAETGAVEPDPIRAAPAPTPTFLKTP